MTDPAVRLDADARVFMKLRAVATPNKRARKGTLGARAGSSTDPGSSTAPPLPPPAADPPEGRGEVWGLGSTRVEFRAHLASFVGFIAGRDRDGDHRLEDRKLINFQANLAEKILDMLSNGGQASPNGELSEEFKKIWLGEFEWVRSSEFIEFFKEKYEAIEE